MKLMKTTLFVVLAFLIALMFHLSAQAQKRKITADDGAAIVGARSYSLTIKKTGSGSGTIVNVSTRSVRYGNGRNGFGNASIVAAPCVPETVSLLSGTIITETITDCSNECIKTYDEPTMVYLSAKANPGSVFEEWSVAECGVRSECTITVDADITVSAKFNVLTGPDSDSPPTIPEPTTFLLFGIGLIGVFGLLWRNRRRKKRS